MGEKRVKPEVFLEKLAFTVFEACQFGLTEGQEASLSEELTNFLESLAQGEVTQTVEAERTVVKPERSGNVEPVDWIEPGNGSEEEDYFSDDVNLRVIDRVVQVCADRIQETTQADTHYQAVCHALVVECLDLIEFLKRVQSKKPRVKKMGGAHEAEIDRTSMSLADEFRDWAKLWMQVVGKLREGVQLRKVASLARAPIVYELTPYEMLMEDIRLRRYSLKNTPTPESSPRKMDAHDIILEYIRSRPPLSSVDNRILRPKKENFTAIELLMDSIRHFKLGTLRHPPPRPANRTGEQSEVRREKSIIQPGASFEMDKSSEIIVPDINNATNAPKRRLVLPDVDSAPPVDFLTSVGEEDDLLVVKTVENDSDDEDGDYLPGEHNLPRSKQRYSEVVSLTLDEIALIRGALAKAELENLEEQDIALYNAIRRSKVCYSCKRAKFTFSWLFRDTGIKCHLCQNTICLACAREMMLPTERLDRIPVYTLSPTIAPEDEPFPHLQQHAQPVSQDLLNKRPLSNHGYASYSATLPRPRSFGRPGLLRSQTQDLASLTLPKSTVRQRPPLQRGMTVNGTVPERSLDVTASSFPDSTNKRGSLPNDADSERIIVQVCVECHSVLYHAIVESQSQLAAIYPRREQGLVQIGIGSRSARNPGKALVTAFRASSSSLYDDLRNPSRSNSHYSLSSAGCLPRVPSNATVAPAFYTSSSSVVSDSHSDSLDDDLNNEEMEDFLDELPVGDRVAVSTSPMSVSRSDSTTSASNSECGSSSKPAVFFTNHI
ncbi:protein spire homolog 1-like isoform X2 [Paramacrobiotus metropolitanus]|uniref:protein spire homolog 1-like isoform X2 n=1 Tax=Paramacrobiotus metropolitanus TaxID=2943436 RepID=UPI002445879A|nr:protein spire homolog 1-like isoform X2 [Paramacrobiotus metropolitanus]